ALPPPPLGRPPGPRADHSYRRPLRHRRLARVAARRDERDLAPRRRVDGRLVAAEMTRTRGDTSIRGHTLVRHCHFTGKAPRLSSDSRPEASADSSRVIGENQGKRAETRGTSAIAPARTVRAFLRVAGREYWRENPRPGATLEI